MPPTAHLSRRNFRSFSCFSLSKTSRPKRDSCLLQFNGPICYTVCVQGVIHSETRCSHWHASFDIVALRFKCCGQYFACHSCHLKLADHIPVRLHAEEDAEELAVMCGVCQTEMTTKEYLERQEDSCPSCAAEWNPGCHLHTHLYFEIPGKP